MDKDQLSAEDLRSKLYHSLREKGLVDALKTQLRNKLVIELKTQGVAQSVYFTPAPTSDSNLLLKAANSLVADHLTKCKYDYSLSVFVPETGNTADKLFTMKELMQLLRISPESKLAKTLMTHASQYNKKGFLWQLLTEIAQCHGYAGHEISCQTDPVALPGINSIEEEFAKLDRKYAELSDDFKSKMVIEERLLSYQHQLDERARTEIKLESARFKENELARMRMEERENARREIDKARKEMERTYKAKYELITEKERHAAEKLQKCQEMQDAETYQQRQSVLDELEVLRQRETSLRRQEEMNKREQQLWDEKIKGREAAAKRREDAARRIEVEYEQKIREEVNRFKIEEQSRYLEWNKSLEIREARVKENERRIDEELYDIKHVKDELREKRQRCSELEIELTKARHDMISYEKKSELLSQKAQEMLDYDMVKEQNAVLKKEVDVLNQRTAELIRDNIVERTKQEDLLREMGAMNTKPTSETYLLRKQIEKLHTDMRQERAVSDHDRAHVERRLQDETDRNQELMRKLEEQTLQQRELLTELKDNRQSLVHHRVALDNEVYRNNRHSFLSRSGSLCDYEDKEASPTRADRPAPRDPADNQLVFEALERSTREEDYSYSSDLVRETRRRLRGLEQEAHDLEENYRNFQVRMSSNSGGVAHDPIRVQLGGNTPARDSAFTSDALHGSPSHLRTRPASSTPSRATSTVRPVTSYTHDLNNSMSTIRSGSPQPTSDTHKASPVVRTRPMSVNDLEARPGSPTVVVMATSETSASHHVGRTGTSGGTTQLPRGGRISPSGEEGTTESKTEGNAPTLSMDEGRQRQQQEQPGPAVTASLDDAWRRQQDEAARKKREDEEADREYEEQRRRREEERRRREEEAWEREQQALREMQGGAGSTKKTTYEEKAEPKAESAGSGPKIDPMMEKYMAMVEQQKTKEKQTAKKALDTWSKGKTFSQDKTPSQSEDFISAAEGDTDNDKSQSQGPIQEDDFW